jgi:GTP-binding protein
MQLENHAPHIIADIPGLIEGAHKGAGLGHKFLKHIERTKILLHIVDASKTIDEIVEDHQTIEQELSRFNETLLSRRKLILLNKIDLLEDKSHFEKLLKIFDNKDVSVLAISALTGSGIHELKKYLVKVLEQWFDE